MDEALAAATITVEVRKEVRKANVWCYTTDRFGKQKFDGAGKPFLNIFPKNSSLVANRIQLPRGTRMTVKPKKIIGVNRDEFWEIVDISKLTRKTPHPLGSFIRVVDVKKIA